MSSAGFGPTSATIAQVGRTGDKASRDRPRIRTNSLKCGRSWPTNGRNGPMSAIASLWSNWDQNSPKSDHLSLPNNGLNLARFDRRRSNLVEPGPELPESAPSSAQIAHIWTNRGQSMAEIKHRPTNNAQSQPKGESWSKPAKFETSPLKDGHNTYRCQRRQLAGNFGAWGIPFRDAHRATTLQRSGAVFLSLPSSASPRPALRASKRRAQRQTTRSSGPGSGLGCVSGLLAPCGAARGSPGRNPERGPRPRPNEVHPQGLETI